MEPVHFELKDRKGESHKYMVEAHPPSEAHRIVLALDAGIAPPLAEFIVSLMSAGDLTGIGDLDIEDLLKNADLSSIAKHVSSAISELDPNLLMDLFRFTIRDGESMSNRDLYDRAYAGNWTEWHKALGKIVQANGFIPFLSMTGVGA